MDPKDSEKFAVLWTAAQPTIAAFIRSLVPNFQQAEEVLQRVAVALVRKFQNYDESRPFTAWAIGMAKYEVLYHRRQRATDKHIFDEETVERIAISYEKFAEEASPMREALRDCVDQLEGRAKEVVHLRYGKGMNSNAIANQMEVSSSAIRMLLSRVRKILRQCVEKRIAEKNSGLTT